ncbi:MAG: ArsR/SmtB family transcription factor [Candidatus Kryptoniota bacterium]
MKRAHVEGQLCIGPTFTKAEFSLIKKNLSEQRGLDILADLLSVSGNRQRLKIIYLLHAHKEMCVCDLAECLNMSTSAVSQHLRKLKDKNIVSSRRERQTIFYSLSANTFTSSLEDILEKEETKEPHSFIYKEVTQ